MKKIQIAMSKVGARIFRNQVGKYKLPNGNYITYGLYPGSSDLIGWHSVVITPSMLGRRVAIFTAIEVKSAKGKASDKQENFIVNVKRAGGVAFVARSTEESITKLFKESPLAKGTGL